MDSYNTVFKGKPSGSRQSSRILPAVHLREVIFLISSVSLVDLSAGWPGSSCVKPGLVRPQEFCFDSGFQRLCPWIGFPSRWCTQESSKTRVKISILPHTYVIVHYQPRFGATRPRPAESSAIFASIVELPIIAEEREPPYSTVH